MQTQMRTNRTRSCILLLSVIINKIPIWQSHSQVDFLMLKMCYPNTRVIVGTTEIFMQRPSNHLTEQATFSSYKNHNTAKALVGITPSGSVSFISRLYRRSISDHSLFHESSILTKMDIGDSVMADRGFNVAEILDVRGMKLNAPPRKW
uniref:DDE Tnp4 domain-containing protein n=1 Tax=Amphimedon queenslandica TaxID=400682 RepID=A0A1X7VAK3_AMPQE